MALDVDACMIASLKADVSIAALVGTRIRNRQLAKGDNPPAIMVQAVADATNEEMPLLPVTDFEINCVGDVNSPTQAEEVYRVVNDFMRDWPKAAAGGGKIKQATLQRKKEDFIEEETNRPFVRSTWRVMMRAE